MDAYNTKLAAAITGAAEWRLRYWDKTGMVKPSVSQASGRGSRRLYSFLDLVQARTANQLREQGLSLQRLRKALRLLKEHPDQIRHPLAELKLVMDGATLFRLTADPNLVQDILGSGQFVSMLAIKPVCDYVRSRIAKWVRATKETVEVAGRKYRVVLEPDVVDGGYIAECKTLPGCVSDGETPEEALLNVSEAIADWLSSARGKHLAKAE